MPKFKVKVRCHFNVVIDSDNVDAAEEEIKLSSTEDLLKLKDNTVIDYAGIEEIQEIS